MKYTISLSREKEERILCENLVKSVYQSKGYVNGDLPELETDSEFLVVKSTDNGEIAGCVGVLFPTRSFESEFFFEININDYLPKNIKREQVVEIGRLTKQPSLKSDFVFIALQIAIGYYIRKHNYKGWIATMKPSLINKLESLGHNLTIADCSIKNSKKLVDSIGGYFNLESEPKLVYNIPVDGDRVLIEKLESFSSRYIDSIEI